MKNKKINIRKKLSKFNDYWSPKVVAEMNDYQFKLAKISGEFIWHQHKSTDEVFYVVEGKMIIEFRDGKVELSKGEMFVVPKGVEHRPRTNGELVLNLLFEPKTTKHTGQVDSDLTVKKLDWI